MFTVGQKLVENLNMLRNIEGSFFLCWFGYWLSECDEIRFYSSANIHGHLLSYGSYWIISIQCIAERTILKSIKLNLNWINSKLQERIYLIGNFDFIQMAWKYGNIVVRFNRFSIHFTFKRPSTIDQQQQRTDTDTLLKMCKGRKPTAIKTASSWGIRLVYICVLRRQKMNRAATTGYKFKFYWIGSHWYININNVYIPWNLFRLFTSSFPSALSQCLT